jgi:hypothetical protein
MTQLRGPLSSKSHHEARRRLWRNHAGRRSDCSLDSATLALHIGRRVGAAVPWQFVVRFTDPIAMLTACALRSHHGHSAGPSAINCKYYRGLWNSKIPTGAGNLLSTQPVSHSYRRIARTRTALASEGPATDVARPGHSRLLPPVSTYAQTAQCAAPRLSNSGIVVGSLQLGLRFTSGVPK